MHDESMILGVGAALAAITLLTYPSVSGLVAQIIKREQRSDDVYSDADGKATAESDAVFSDKLPKAAVLLSALLGAGSSLAASVLATLNDGRDKLFVENWLVTASWVCFHFLAIAMSCCLVSHVASKLTVTAPRSHPGDRHRGHSPLV